MNTAVMRILISDPVADRRLLHRDRLCEGGHRVVVISTPEHTDMLLGTRRCAVDLLLIHASHASTDLLRYADLAQAHGLPLVLNGHVSPMLAADLRERHGDIRHLDPSPAVARGSSILLSALHHIPQLSVVRPTVWIVDDDDAIQTLTRIVLRQTGHEVLSSTTVREALDLLKTGINPDVVLLDVHLSDGMGLDVLRAIREKSKVPVAMLSGSRAPALLRDAFELGANDYLLKPIHPRELADRIDRLL